MCFKGAPRVLKRLFEVLCERVKALLGLYMSILGSTEGALRVLCERVEASSGCYTSILRSYNCALQVLYERAESF